MAFNLEKFTPDRIFYTGSARGARDNYEVWFQVVSGPMVDLVGGKRTMLVSNIVAGASTLATPWLVSNFL